MIFYTAENYTNDLAIPKTNYTHGMHGSREYNSWHTLKQRCLRRNNPSYASYGGRGIGVCERWLRFENFYEDMGKKPDSYEIDRIDNDKGYFKENCRWVNRAISSFNTRRKTGEFPRGVRKTKSNSYYAHICIYDRQIHVGTFKTIEEASNAYDTIALEWFGFIPPKMQPQPAR